MEGLKGGVVVVEQLLPCMRSMHYGRIVNITSMAAKTGGVTAGTAYSVSKGALSSLTFSLARETVRRRKMRVAYLASGENKVLKLTVNLSLCLPSSFP